MEAFVSREGLRVKKKHLIEEATKCCGLYPDDLNTRISFGSNVMPAVLSETLSMSNSAGCAVPTRSQ